MSIQYDFDEVPLVPGTWLFAAGRAEIGYDRNGAWGIDAIDLDGPGHTHVPCPKTGPDFGRIVAVLQVEHREQIEAAINADMDEAADRDAWTRGEAQAERVAA